MGTNAQCLYLYRSHYPKQREPHFIYAYGRHVHEGMCISLISVGNRTYEMQRIEGRYHLNVHTS